MGSREEMGSFDLARFTVAGWLVFLMSAATALFVGIGVGFACISVFPATERKLALGIGGAVGAASGVGSFFGLKAVLDSFGVVVVRPKPTHYPHADRSVDDPPREATREPDLEIVGTMNSWVEMIERCRSSFGSAPRELGSESQRLFRLRPSLILRIYLFLNGGMLRSFLRDQNILRDQGRVVWGVLVQANQILFNPDNRSVLPAEIICSPDTYFDDRVPLLQSLAQGLYQLKGTSPQDKELARFAHAITDERLRSLRLPLPRSICEGKEAHLMPCLVQPSHLPGQHLAAGFFPLVICPEKTDAVMILPSQYWPVELCVAWLGHQG